VGATLRVQVLAGSDPLRIEQLTHDLLGTLSNSDVARTGVTISPVTRVAGPGSKGNLEAIVALLVAGAPYAQPAADVLIAAIQGWCARDRRVRVLVSDGDRRAEIVGDPTPTQREIVDDFWRRGLDT
jgi:hypothetical protein